MRRQAEIAWHRVLGRLQRLTVLNMQQRLLHQDVIPDSSTGFTSDDLPLIRGSQAEPRSRSNSIGPTDPAVYHAGQPESPDFEDNLSAPSTSELIRDIIDKMDDMDNRSSGRDTVNGRISTHTPIDPPPLYANADRPESPCSLVEQTYVEMHPDPARRPPIPAPRPMNTPTTSATQTAPEARAPPEPIAGPSRYENVTEPAYLRHRGVHRPMPIPQGSPRPPLPAEIPAPLYYRDILNPYVFPAYYFICHSAWYTQISDHVVLCNECSIGEHTFCVQGRQNAICRNLHIIARNLHHTDLHCGRCYRLLLHTRRAIDCYFCRKMIIDLQGRTEQLEYRVMCEISLPRRGL